MARTPTPHREKRQRFGLTLHPDVILFLGTQKPYASKLIEDLIRKSPQFSSWKSQKRVESQ